LVNPGPSSTKPSEPPVPEAVKLGKERQRQLGEQQRKDEALKNRLFNTGTRNESFNSRSEEGRLDRANLSSQVFDQHSKVKGNPNMFPEPQPESSGSSSDPTHYTQSDKT
jgi:hypothetical protein